MSLSKPLTLRHLCHLLNKILGLFYQRHIVFFTISLVKNTKCYLPKKRAPEWAVSNCLLGVELRCKLPGKLHRVTGPLAHHVVLNHTFELLINTKMLFSYLWNEHSLTENSHMISHMKFSYVKSLCGIGTIHIWKFHMWNQFHIWKFHIWNFHMWNHYVELEQFIYETFTYESFTYEIFICEIVMWNWNHSYMKISHMKFSYVKLVSLMNGPNCTWRFHIWNFHMWKYFHIRDFHMWK